MLSFIILCLFLMFSKYGDIKLGKEKDEPQFGYISWIAMLFSSGMGIGLIFFGVSEPIMHLHEPAIASNNLVRNARASMNYTFFHWGLQPWSLYAFLGLIIAYNTFRHNRLALISESVVYLFKEEKRKKVADITNIIAIILLYAGGLEALQAVSVLSSFPFVFIIILMTIQFFKSLTADKRLKI